MERSGVRIVVVGVAATMVAAVLAVYALRSLPSDPDLTESDYGGKMHLLVNDDARALYPSSLLMIEFTSKTRVKVQHPVGMAEGSVRISGRRLAITFESVDGLPATEWSEKWPAIRSKLLTDKIALANRKRRPDRYEHPLRGVRNEQEALQALERADYAASVMNPFGQKWEWEVPVAENWIPLNPLTPEFR